MLVRQLLIRQLVQVLHLGPDRAGLARADDLHSHRLLQYHGCGQVRGLGRQVRGHPEQRC